LHTMLGGISSGRNVRPHELW